MVKIIYVACDGAEHEVDVDAGMTIMEGARDNEIPGLDADCGGACSCSTCHVYVAPEWAPRIPEAGWEEDGMLDFASGRKATSRLSCQVRVTPTMDGLRVHMPERQG